LTGCDAILLRDDHVD
jgi:hypothetical protein